MSDNACRARHRLEHMLGGLATFGVEAGVKHHGHQGRRLALATVLHRTRRTCVNCPLAGAKFPHGLLMSAGFSDDVMWVLPNWEVITQRISFFIFFSINVNPGYADLTNLTTRLCVSLVVPSL